MIFTSALLLFSVLAFATTEPWAVAILQIGVFAQGFYYAILRKLRWHPAAFAPAGVVVLGGLQLVTNSTVYRFATEQALLNWAAYFVLFVVAFQALAEPEVRRKFLRAALYAGSAIALIATVQNFTSDGAIYWVFRAPGGRPFGPFVNRDHYAVFVELILPLAIVAAGGDRRRVWFHMAIAGMLYGSVIASASRAGAVLMTIELLALPLLGKPARGAGKFAVLCVAAAGLATAVAGPDVLWNKFQDKDPFRYRREIFASTAQMIRQRPWTGFGLGTYRVVYPEFASFDVGAVVDHAHNDWAEWTAEGGAPMLLLMLAMAAASLRPALRSGWGVGIPVVLVHALVDFPLQIPAIAALLFTFLAALCHEANASGSAAPLGYTT
jgi:O-antigen ligase